MAEEWVAMPVAEDATFERDLVALAPVFPFVFAKGLLGTELWFLPFPVFPPFWLAEFVLLRVIQTSPTLKVEHGSCNNFSVVFGESDDQPRPSTKNGCSGDDGTITWNY